ncbi:hypothetical protein LOK49_LG07G00311 [Camellia lanceoleosa]|uniref:Uncharacterized protein n=1 Tax=Camellia lanceoleosa TaxID=1840588 RepID=A0ACC0GZI0_9ERIC|nr:hypothetical protein LOK49_Contig650G00003 [Camellia lanceoleosa]KAI8006632.1 hypothetical protein LOK49_LG07G00311 [Camellia lanceoleosa]
MYSSFFIVLCDYFHLNSVSHQGELGRRRTIGIQRLVVAGAEEGMSLRIKAVVDKFVQELKEALDADIQDRIMKEREMQSYIQEREREVAEREAAWKAELSRREAEIARQEARLKMERENLEKEKSVLMGTASNQDNQDGALEITVSGEKYRCLRFAKAKK